MLEKRERLAGTKEDLARAKKELADGLSIVVNRLGKKAKKITDVAADFATDHLAGGLGSVLNQAGGFLSELAEAKQNKRLENLWALDFGSQTMRLCRLKTLATGGYGIGGYGIGGYGIGGYGKKSLVFDPLMVEAERHAARLAAIGELFSEAGAKHKNVICGLPGRSVWTRYQIFNQPVSESELPTLVRRYIQQSLPFALEEIRMNYQVLRRTEDGGYEVLMAAVKTDVAEKYLTVLTEAGCQVRCLTINPVAAYNWLRFVGEINGFVDGETTAMIDLGASGTNIVIERVGQFRFTRPISIGGDDITKAIQDSLQMNSFFQAEFVKLEDIATLGETGAAVIASTNAILDKLAEEIKRSFDYFRSLPGGGAVTRVVLTGGGAELSGIVLYLQNKLDVEVRLANPLAGFLPPNDIFKSNQNQMATVLGLALQAQRKSEINLNLAL